MIDRQTLNKKENKMKTYTHRLTGERLRIIKESTQDCPVFPGSTNAGFIFVNETGKERFLTYYQVGKLLR
jgi:hypothetical protein